MLKLSRGAFCGALVFIFLLSALTAFAADAKPAAVKIEYDEIEELVRANDMSYHMYLMDIEILQDSYNTIDNILYDVGELSLINIELASIAEAAAPSRNTLISLKESIEDTKKAVDDFILTEIFIAQASYLTYFDLCNQKALAEEMLSVLQKKYNNAKIKFEYGLISQKDFDDAEKAAEDQKDIIRAYDDAIRDNVNNIKTLLNIPISTEVSFGDAPEPDLSFIDNTDYEKDLESYLKNSKKILAAQRDYNKKVREKSNYTDADRSKAKLNIEKVTGEEKLAFENSYNSLIKNSDDYKKAATDLEKDIMENEKLRKKLDAGMISEMMFADASFALKNAVQALKSQELRLYIQAGTYFNSLEGR